MIQSFGYSAASGAGDLGRKTEISDVEMKKTAILNSICALAKARKYQEAVTRVTIMNQETTPSQEALPLNRMKCFREVTLAVAKNIGMGAAIEFASFIDPSIRKTLLLNSICALAEARKYKQAIKILTMVNMNTSLTRMHTNALELSNPAQLFFSKFELFRSVILALAENAGLSTAIDFAYCISNVTRDSNASEFISIMQRCVFIPRSGSVSVSFFIVNDFHFVSRSEALQLISRVATMRGNFDEAATIAQWITVPLIRSYAFLEIVNALVEVRHFEKAYALASGITMNEIRNQAFLDIGRAFSRSGDFEKAKMVASQITGDKEIIRHEITGSYWGFVDNPLWWPSPSRIFSEDITSLLRWEAEMSPLLEMASPSRTSSRDFSWLRSVRGVGVTEMSLLLEMAGRLTPSRMFSLDFVDLYDQSAVARR